MNSVFSHQPSDPNGTGSVILDLLFQGHHVRVIRTETETWFVAADVCEILQIKNPWRAVRSLPQSRWDRMVFDNQSCPTDSSGSSCRNSDIRCRLRPGQRSTQTVLVVNKIGVQVLACGSRTPQAEAFQDFVFGEVVLQIELYGVYLPDADPETCFKLAFRCIRDRKRRKVMESEKELAESGRITISMFKDRHGIQPRDILSFARHATQIAKEIGEPRIKTFTPSGMRRAWSEAVLQSALCRYQPLLPLWGAKGHKISEVSA